MSESGDDIDISQQGVLCNYDLQRDIPCGGQGRVCYNYEEMIFVQDYHSQEMNMTCVWRRRKCFFREQILGVFERNEANHQCAEERSYCKRSINFYDIYISI